MYRRAEGQSDLVRAVGRAVVDDHDLDLEQLVALRQHTDDRLGRKAFAISDRDDDGHELRATGNSRRSLRYPARTDLASRSVCR
jgi:hypothetical protein